MKVIAVYEITTCEEIEVPDGTTEAEAEEIAGEYLDAHFAEICEEICLGSNPVELKEVYL